MTSIPLSEARAQLPEIVNKVAYGAKRIILTRRGKKIAAVVSIEELELIEALEDRIDIEDAIKALKDIKKNGSVAWKKVKADLGI
jgi:prevent-host-death family protein